MRVRARFSSGPLCPFVFIERGLIEGGKKKNPIQDTIFHCAVMEGPRCRFLARKKRAITRDKRGYTRRSKNWIIFSRKSCRKETRKGRSFHVDNYYFL